MFTLAALENKKNEKDQATTTTAGLGENG